MMRCRTQLIVGPAGTGKTARALDGYLVGLQARRPAAAVWLAPSGRAAVQARRRIVTALPAGAVLNPGVYTFASLAEAVLRGSRVLVRRVGPLEKRALLAQIIDEAHDAKRLRYFGALAGSSGLIDLVVQFIAEWKRLEIWPDEFRQAASRRGSTPKDAELATLYEQYQSLLARHNWFDAEGQIWLARALLRDGQSQAFPQLDILVADGFSDFTRTEHEILELLAARASQSIVTLPFEISEERRDLFAKAGRTAQQFRMRHADCEVTELARRGGDWSAMHHLEQRLFGHPRRTFDAPDAAQLEILAAGRELGEVELIAARVKSLLVDGDPDDRRGVAPDNIVVAYRSLESVAPLIRETFARFGIPFYLETSRRLLDVPLIAALLQLLRMHDEDWPFLSVLAVLNQNFLQPHWAEWSSAVAGALERLIRSSQLPRGRAALLETCARLAAAASISVDGTEESADRIRAAHSVALLDRFARTLTRLPERATARQWLKACEAIARELGYFASNYPEDRVGWQLLIDAGETLDRLHEVLDRDHSFTLSELVDWFEEVCASTPLPQEHDEVGRVRILAAASLRALDVPYLFVAGLSEQAFPAADREGRIYSESECRQLVEAGLPLVLRAERAEEEMLLFYETLTRARRRLYLSFPAIDDRAQPLSPSPYLTEVERAFGATPIPRYVSTDLRPLPHGDVDWNARDRRVRAVLSAAEGRALPLARLIVGREQVPSGKNLLTGLEVIQSRSKGEVFGRFEGMFGASRGQQACAHRFGAERVWSATDLELYGACPFKFFLSRVLRVQPLVEAELSTDYLGRGARMHQALAALHRYLNVNHAPGLSPHTLDTASYEALIDRLLSERNTLADEDGSLLAALLDIERLELREWLVGYPAQHEQYASQTGPAAMQPLYFEAAFGMRNKRRDDEPARDELSVDETLELRQGEDVVRIAGRIDRVDLAEVAGRVVFNVLDYKTGKHPTTKQIASGKALQLPLYALAVERLLLKDQDALPWQIGYWSVAERGFKEGYQLGYQDGAMAKPTDSWRDLLGAIEQRVFALVRGLRGGEFPMYNEDRHCASRCEFRRACRVNQTRALGKLWQPPREQPSG